MDFLIGGVPRSGTSIAGITFNFHSQAFCYAAETHWIPFLNDIAGNAPVPASCLTKIRRVFASQNRRVLVEKVRRNVDRGGNPGMLVFNAGDTDALTDQAIALLEAGMFGAELCRNAARILREYIHKKVGRPVIGEKTPSNVFAFRDYGALGARVAFTFTREPFAVIRSMQNRARNEQDRTASLFRRDLLELVGMYAMYMDAISVARAQPGVAVVTYEDMLANSRAIIGGMFSAAGLAVRDQALNAAAGRIRVITPGHAWEGFSPGERSLILGLTGRARSGSPYDQDFFSELGLDAGQTGDPVPEAGNAFLPMYGVNAAASWSGGRWLMRDSCFAVVRGRAARKLELSICADFPGSVLASGETATLTARDYVEKKVLASLEVRGGRKMRTAIGIDLDDVTPVCTGRNGLIGMVELNSSHAFRPDLVPDARIGLRIFGRGHRLLSFMLAGCSFG